MPEVRPYGSWKSPLTSDLIVAETVGLGQIALDGEDIYWLEHRPSEGGRSAIVRRTPDGGMADLLPPPWNARTRVHEYGGGDFLAVDGLVFFSNFADQRFYRWEPEAPPRPITPEAPLRYADGILDRLRNRIICVCEDHTRPGREPANSIVALHLNEGRPRVLISGKDFYSSPRLSPDGSLLAWLSWNHPNMPWDGTELWVGELDEEGRPLRAERVAGGGGISIFQPEWAPNGILYFVSDLTGWWNIYCWKGEREEEVTRMEAEFGLSQWIFGLSTYAVVSAGRILCAFFQPPAWRLASLDLTSGKFEVLPTPYTEIAFLRASLQQAVFVGGSPVEPRSIIKLELESGETSVLRRSSNISIDPEYLSPPQAITFPTENRMTAHAYFYPPKNRDHVSPIGELPPLLVMTHGGPTASASNTLNLAIQYWTSRGIAVADVNYGGSAGYGRDYRRRLEGQWGVVDVDDAVNCARYLVKKELVDGNRLAIRGGSAGGFTALCALTFRDFFQAGASHYGVSDLEALAKETHKFESHYLDRLIGPYPERSDLYIQRSPIHGVDRLLRPVIFFQGLEDRIVPPNQTEKMVEALRAKGLPVAYVPFAGEQHGFRRAENIKRALDAELHFYSRLFGFKPADPIEAVPIANLPEP